MTCPVVFDLDGTLIDSAPDIAAAVNAMLAAEGCAPLDLPTATSFIGNGLPRLVARVIEARALPAGDHPRLTAAMRAQYDAAPARLTRPYPGVPAMLAALAARGHPLGLCTNKPEGPARAVLRDLGLLPFFASVLGGDRLPVLKPDPAPLLACVAELGHPAPPLFVGDSEVDAATARAAGVPFLLFTRGYRKSPAADLAPAASFDDHARLPALIARLSPAAPPPGAAGR
jgi:phosphoglycolate phosphatase